jgi:hypothetical protein
VTLGLEQLFLLVKNHVGTTTIWTRASNETFGFQPNRVRALVESPSERGSSVLRRIR